MPVLSRVQSSSTDELTELMIDSERQFNILTRTIGPTQLGYKDSLFAECIVSAILISFLNLLEKMILINFIIFFRFS